MPWVASVTSPHDVGAGLVVLRILGGDAAGVDERAHKALVDIVGGAVAVAGEVLLHKVAHDVEEARHHLVLRHRHGEARVEDGETGEEGRAEDLAAFEAFFAIGDDAAAVHLAAGAHHGEHGTHGDGLAVGALLAHPVFLPGVFLAVGRGRDTLGIVDSGAAAHCEDEVDVVVAHQAATLEDLLVGGVGHHAGVFDDGLACGFKCRDDSVVDAVFLNRAAAVAEHHRRPVVFQLLDEMAHGVFAEIQFGGIVKFKIALHTAKLIYFKMQIYKYFFESVKKIVSLHLRFYVHFNIKP